MRARTVAKAATVLALLIVLLVLLMAAVCQWRCFLDALNWAIWKQCRKDQRAFYAGGPNTPPTREARLPRGTDALGPALGRLEDNWRTVRAELDGMLVDRSRIPPLHETYGIMFGVDKATRHKRSLATRIFQRLVYGDDIELVDGSRAVDWRTIILVLFDNDVPGNADRCPETVRLLRQIPGFQSAFFSILAPHSGISLHSDPSKGVVRYHLALKVPQDRANCWIEVAGQRHHWTEGGGVLFDETLSHRVRNDTDEERIILFVDILRPLSGAAAGLQALANFANKHQPSVRRAIRASVI